MKKILPIILILILLASPVAADPAYRLIVDNVTIDRPVVLIGNVSYVPIRAVADAFNVAIEWDGATNTININSKQVITKEIARPPINGDEEFTSKINAALDLLEQKDFPHYVMVCENTTAIKQAAVRPSDSPENSIASANTLQETIIHPELTENKEWYTPVFLAGILTHEACHHIDWKFDGATNREKEAKNHQRAVYDLLEAPQWMKDTWK